MNTITHSILAGIILASTQAVADETTELEPCINGEVSASGLFANQKAENKHRNLQYITVTQSDLEPCINGEVSASGLFTNQEAEDSYRQRSDFRIVNRSQ